MAHPLNEPIVNALMCGKPPCLRGDGGYIRIMVQLAKGIINTVEAIKEADASAMMVHVEATGLSRAARKDLEILGLEDQRRSFLCYDLMTGAVTPDHPMFSWVVRNGVSPDDLEAITNRSTRLDVIGMNFYPQWSTQEIHFDKKGRLVYRSVEPDGAGFAALIEDYYDRYRAPIIITATSAFGPDEVRLRWLQASMDAIKHLRGSGVEVYGYTWFPMFTMIDWRYRFGLAPLERYRIELGLYKLRDNPNGGRWEPTPLIEQFQSFINNPDDAVGELIMKSNAPNGKSDD